MAHLAEQDIDFDENVLLVAGRDLASTAEVHRTCFDHRGFGGRNVLRVMYTDTPVSLFDWTEEYGTRPQYGAIIVAARPSGVENDEAPRDDVVSLISNRNLDSLGGRVTRAVESISENRDEPIHICFSWVDTLISVMGEENTFQFLHLLLKMINSTGACAGHFHMDPENSAKEQQFMLEQLFDRVTVPQDHHESARTTTGATSDFDDRV